jgi:capsular exopolysaccharide synthesis family protein
MTFQDYKRILYRGRRIILISFLVVMATTMYYTWSIQPVYEASAMVMVKEEGGAKQQIFEVADLMKMENKINNQVEILKSRTLAESVIHRLQDSPYADTLWILGKRKNRSRYSVDRWLNDFLRKTGQESKLLSPEAQFDKCVRSFKGVITVTPKRATDMIELKVRALSPVEAAFTANTWVNAYRDMDISASSGEVSAIKKFLQDKLKDVQDSLSSSEENLRHFKENQKVAELTKETEKLIEQMTAFETQFQAAKTDLEANDKRLTYLKDQLNESQKAILGSQISSPMIQELESQMGQLIGQKASFDQQMKGMDYEDPTKTAKDQRLEGLRQKIVEAKKQLVASGTPYLNPLKDSETLVTTIIEIETENTALKAKIGALSNILRNFNKELDALPEKELHLAQLSREREVNSNIFMMLRQKYEENRILEAGQIGLIRIVDTAKPPQRPVKPDKGMNLLLGILLGLGLGVGIVFAREYLDTTLKTIEDLEALGFTVLASVPVISTETVKRHAKSVKVDGDYGHIESRLITHLAPKSPISEAYRTFRTNIQYAKTDGSINTVMVTSSGPGEGKSTSVANLAIAIAQTGANTLLIDTDLRRPVLHGIFGIPKDQGLTNVLVGRLTLDEAAKSTAVDHLKLLTSGTLPPNPSELLASQTMDRFIQEVSTKFDMVLFDSPPVIAVTDAAVLAPKVDGVVLVAKSGATSKDALIRSKALLDNVNANIFGVLLNGINIDRMYGSYYYYYHYYYYGEGKKGKKSKSKLLK